MEPTKSERESFWDAKTYAVITDHTKPAIKWAISELKNRGKNVYVIDLSDKPEPGSLRNVSELPAGLDRAVLGVTKTDPGDLIPALKEKGITKIWLHWKPKPKKPLEPARQKVSNA